jgi:predicted glycoside hydrolase/deacetylase ChbG (UPF0249 family)
MNKKLLTIILVVSILMALASAFAQTNNASLPGQATSKSLVERLGYAADQKLLIVHADDLGVAHSVNRASIKALETGLVSSASVMIPCPWLPEVAAYFKGHPQTDLGLHLTLTSEWKQFRWAPVIGRERAPSLVDADGYFYSLESEAAAHIDTREAESELRAQIARAKAFGINPTHLDSHMGTLYQNKALFEVLMKLAHENKLPVRLSQPQVARSSFMSTVLGPDDVVLNRIISIEPDVTAADWSKFYTEAVRNLQPGVTVMIVHLAYDDEEMKGVTSEHPNWGAAWRQRDFDLVTSDGFRRVLAENHVKLITWREVGKLIKP